MDGIIQNVVAPRMFALHIAFMIGKNNNMANMVIQTQLSQYLQK